MRFWTIGPLLGCLVTMSLLACGAESAPKTTASPSPIPPTKSLPTLPSDIPGPTDHSESEELRYLALGDSYTIGESVAAADRWPVQLVERLREAGVRVADAEIIARTGWTTKELAAGIQAVGPEGPFDMVTLLIGVNNQFRGLDINQYSGEFTDLLISAVQFAGDEPSRVIVVSIPDWSVTPFARSLGREGITQEIDRFNLINEKETARIGAAYVDVTKVSRRAAAEPNLLAGDGLHPSGDMYQLWADLILPAALAIATTER